MTLAGADLASPRNTGTPVPERVKMRLGENRFQVDTWSFPRVSFGDRIGRVGCSYRSAGWS